MNNPLSKNRQWPEASKYISAISVFDPPSLFAKTLSETIPIKPGVTRLLDIGCGSGIIGIYCLIEQKAQFVTFNDIQDIAILETRANVTMHHQTGLIHESQVAAQKGSFATIPPAVIAYHDLMVFNPPQLPTDFIDRDYLSKIEIDSSNWQFRNGGRDGLDIVREFLDWYADLREPKPDATILLSSFIGRKLISETIQSYGIGWKIQKETKVPLRSILNRKADEFANDRSQRDDRSLEQNAPADPAGKWSKQLLTIQVTSKKI